MNQFTNAAAEAIALRIARLSLNPDKAAEAAAEYQQAVSYLKDDARALFSKMVVTHRVALEEGEDERKA